MRNKSVDNCWVGGMTSIAIAIVMLTGCATSQPRMMPVTAEFAPSLSREPASNPSLFSADAAVLSDADIDRILRFTYVPPKQTRIAVLALGQARWFEYSDELARSGEEVQKRFTDQLETAPAIKKASYLPSLLIPATRSVGYFREAAARYQADTLIVYQSSCRTYEKYRVFASNTSKSFCNVEAAILDVRTGIVPFTTTVTQEFSADQTGSDANIYETMRKAELSAISDALGRVADQIILFFGNS